MTEDELRDWAYHESTGQHLTEDFSYKEFQEINTLDHVWSPFEDWSESMLERQIVDVAESIIKTAKHYLKENT